jgi:DNA-binding PadR family transcriptional regulator
LEIIGTITQLELSNTKITKQSLQMKGTNLGEFEELVLLTVAALMDEAYSVAVCDELSAHTGRSVKLGVVHAVLNRLEEKGLVQSQLGEATKARGGKRKRHYQVTVAGKAALVRTKEVRDQLWGRIPSLVWKNG